MGLYKEASASFFYRFTVGAKAASAWQAANLACVFHFDKALTLGLKAMCKHMPAAVIRLACTGLHGQAEVPTCAPDFCRRLVVDAFIQHLLLFGWGLAVPPAYFDLGGEVVKARTAIAHRILYRAHSVYRGCALRLLVP